MKFRLHRIIILTSLRPAGLAAEALRRFRPKAVSVQIKSPSQYPYRLLQYFRNIHSEPPPKLRLE